MIKLTSVTLAAGAAGLVMLGQSSFAQNADIASRGFAITSTTFQDGGMMPTRTTSEGTQQRPWCNGQNISPQLSFVKPPPGTKSFVLTQTTAEPEDVNVVLYGIPASVTSLAEGELSKPSDKFVEGKNRFGSGLWRGPCNPPGYSAHHFIIRVVATDLDPKALPPGLTLEEIQPKLKGHTREVAAIVGVSVKE